MNSTDDQQAEALRAAAYAHYEAGRDQEARPLLERYLALRRNDAEAYYRLANLLKDAGEYDQAERCYRDALALRPEHARTQNNLGVLLELTGRTAEARVCYESAAKLDAGLHQARLNLGRMSEAAGELAAAVQSYRAAIELDPKEFQPHGQLGRVMENLGRLDEALASYQRVLELRPERFWSYVDYGRALVLAQRADAAIGVYRQAIARDIEPEYFRHLVHAVSGEDSDRAPVGYVKGLFDHYAESFDKHLVQALAYRAPAMLARQLAALSEGRRLSILDLGCGTGLCGLELRTQAQRLVGVDLSAAMLQQAAAKGMYDELVEMELNAYLRDAAEAAFDAAVAADVFIYIGDVSALFVGVRRVLKPGGLFAFSTESLDSTPRSFSLRQSGRYAHAAAYLRSLAERTGFEELRFERAVIRTESGQPVQGDLVVLRRSGA